jgi:hypothetical protein
MIMKTKSAMGITGGVVGLRSLLGIALFSTLAAAAPCQAQYEPAPAGDKRMGEMVDNLKELIQKAEREQRSDPRLLKQLRELVRRYDWPWKTTLLHEDFRDGDFTYDPAWMVRNGDFWVARGGGLRTAHDPTRQVRRTAERKGDYSAMGLLEEIIGGSRERDGRTPTQPVSTAPAEIYTPLQITNAFVVKLQIIGKSDRQGGNGIEFGPYLRDERDAGYRLAYEAGPRPALVLSRVSARRSAIIESYNQVVALEDGRAHLIEWRRGGDGEMVVLVDDQEVMRTTDRGFGDTFAGFTLLNKGGEYEVRQVTIYGTER